ncbi:hypothetical protein K737_300370 [Holospora undulata HU1]|uniref:Uncharacterized protein n=1 Tax=Holospora undulata HU1 TaxID=1321371 RepID=A0A061JGI0_9PROT|nr:hypothetical protein K737_300370 [Holospora undulata HU1]
MSSFYRLFYVASIALVKAKVPEKLKNDMDLIKSNIGKKIEMLLCKIKKSYRFYY